MIVTTRDCEIVKQLVAAFCDHDPEGLDISVGECLDLFARMVLASWDRGPVSELNTGAGRPAEERTTPPALRATSPCTGEALDDAERERERERDADAGRLRFACR